jgi:hypothetical protein
MSFLKRVVKTAGKGVMHVTGTSLIAKGSRYAAKKVGKVKFIGKPFAAVFNLAGSPVYFTESVLKGERIDKAALANLKAQVRDIKEVGPYAQMVISCVPGIGTGISAGLGAGLALANGQPITAALKAGVVGALPGGPAVQMAANMAIAVAEKKAIDKIVIASLPLPDAQKKAITIALDAAKALAKGQRIDKVALAAAEKAIPAQYRVALQVGVAVAHGENIQKTMLKNVTPAVLTTLAGQGGAVITVNPALKAGFEGLKNKADKAGFSVGAAISRMQVNPMEVVAIRNKLKPLQKRGFDLALVGHIGMVEDKTPANLRKNPAATFAFNAAVGAQALPAKNQKAIVKQIVKSPQARAAVTVAINAGPKVALNETVTPGSNTGTIAYVKPQDKGFWHQLFVALGFIKE